MIPTMLFLVSLMNLVVNTHGEAHTQEAELRKSREKQQAELRQAQLEQRQALTEVGSCQWLKQNPTVEGCF